MTTVPSATRTVAPAGRLRRTSPAVPLRVSPEWRRQYAALLVLVDLAAAVAAGAVALLVRYGDSGGPRTPYVICTMVGPLLYVAAVAAGRAYEGRFLGTGSEEHRRLLHSAVTLAAAVASAAYGFNAPIPRGYVVVAFPLSVVASLAGRSIARALLRVARRRGSCQHRVLLVGTERSVAEMVRQVARDPDAGFTVVGACIDRSAGEQVEGVPVVGTSATIQSALWSTNADTLAVTAWSILTQRELRRISWELEGSDVEVLVAPAITDIAGPRISVRPVAGLPLLHVEQPEFTGYRRIMKGLFDRGLALGALLLLAPMLLAVGLTIRLTSSGPALFRQRRVGKAGDEFTIYKFRTMYVDAETRLAELEHRNEASDGLLFKLRFDPRVTKVGARLRRYSVDELPQLLNVVRGQMSLVGPRPPLPTEVAQYEDDVHRRLLVKPGLTGLWQVSGRSDLPWDEAVRLDLDYVENWSLALDISILWRTGAAVVASRGAY